MRKKMAAILDFGGHFECVCLTLELDHYLLIGTEMKLLHQFEITGCLGSGHPTFTKNVQRQHIHYVCI